jgi:hypothetical protein
MVRTAFLFATIWKETIMINPGMMMKLMNAKNTFESNHPKFAAFVSRFFMGGAITEGTIIEITITRPGEEPVSTNLTVKAGHIIFGWCGQPFFLQLFGRRPL